MKLDKMPPPHRIVAFEVSATGSGARDRLCQNGDVRNFAVVVHEEPVGGYWAEVPALPGCYSQGDSLPELTQNLREAITGVLAVMREQGAEPESNVQLLDIAV